jgi:hypothetical protein
MSDALPEIPTVGEFLPDLNLKVPLTLQVTTDEVIE